MMSGQRQAHQLRLAYFRSVISQDMTWFDAQGSGALSARLADDINKARSQSARQCHLSHAAQVQEAISDKLGSLLQFSGMFFAGFIIGFLYGWKLTLVLLSVTPLLAICGA